VPYETLDKAGCLKVEPALANVQEKFVGALRLPGDETGDCFKFYTESGKAGRRAGVQFKYGVTIQKLVHEGDEITSSSLRKANSRRIVMCWHWAAIRLSCCVIWASTCVSD
jgi:glycine/D-amino acid oxidase-like deaminating enzyme